MSVRVVGEATGNKGLEHHNSFYIGTTLYQINNNVKFEDGDNNVHLASIFCATVEKKKKISCSFKLYAKQDEESKELILESGVSTFPFKDIKILEKIWVLRKQDFELNSDKYTGREVYYCEKEKKNGKLLQLPKISIYQAVLENDFASTSMLISCDHEDVNIPHSTTTSTVLHYACQYGYIDLITLLLDAGADYNATNKEGFTPLHFASCEGFQASDSVEPVKLLLRRGARTDIKDKLEKKTPLEWAQDYECTRVANCIKNWPASDTQEEEEQQAKGEEEGEGEDKNKEKEKGKNKESKEKSKGSKKNKEKSKEVKKKSKEKSKDKGKAKIAEKEAKNKSKEKKQEKELEEEKGKSEEKNKENGQSEEGEGASTEKNQKEEERRGEEEAKGKEEESQEKKRKKTEEDTTPKKKEKKSKEKKRKIEESADNSKKLKKGKESEHKKSKKVETEKQESSKKNKPTNKKQDKAKKEGAETAKKEGTEKKKKEEAKKEKDKIEKVESGEGDNKSTNGKAEDSEEKEKEVNGGSEQIQVVKPKETKKEGEDDVSDLSDNENQKEADKKGGNTKKKGDDVSDLSDNENRKAGQKRADTSKKADDDVSDASDDESKKDNAKKTDDDVSDLSGDESKKATKGADTSKKLDDDVSDLSGDESKKAKKGANKSKKADDGVSDLSGDESKKSTKGADKSKKADDDVSDLSGDESKKATKGAGKSKKADDDVSDLSGDEHGGDVSDVSSVSDLGDDEDRSKTGRSTNSPPSPVSPPLSPAAPPTPSVASPSSPSSPPPTPSVASPSSPSLTSPSSPPPTSPSSPSQKKAKKVPKINLPECYVYIESLEKAKKAYERKRSSKTKAYAVDDSEEEVSEKPHKRIRRIVDDDDGEEEEEKVEEKKPQKPVVDRRAAIEREKERIRLQEEKAKEAGPVRKQMARPSAPLRKKSILDELDDVPKKSPNSASSKNNVLNTKIPKKAPTHKPTPAPPARDTVIHETTDKKLELLLKYEKMSLIRRLDPASAEFAKLAEELRTTARKGKRMELDMAWTVQHDKINSVFDACTVKNIQIGYHSSNLDTLLNIVSDGFRLPPDTFNKAGNTILLLGRMIYFASQAGNSLHYADECDYSLRVEMKVGNVKTTESKMTMEPSALMRSGFDSIFSKTVSKRGEIWAIPHPSQVAPRYLLKFSKVPQDALSGVVSRKDKLPRVGYVIQQYGQSGLVDENRDFICVWDKHPAFTIHCLVLPKRKVMTNNFKLEDLEILDKMEQFVQSTISRYRDIDPNWKFEYGFSMYSAEKLLHCHLFTANSQNEIQSKNTRIQRKFSQLYSFTDLRKFLPVAIANNFSLPSRPPSPPPRSSSSSYSPPSLSSSSSSTRRSSSSTSSSFGSSRKRSRSPPRPHRPLSPPRSSSSHRPLSPPRSSSSSHRPLSPPRSSSSHRPLSPPRFPSPPSPLSLPQQEAEPSAIEKEITFVLELQALQKQIFDEYGVSYPLEVIRQSACDLLTKSNQNQANFRPSSMPLLANPNPIPDNSNPPPVPLHIPRPNLDAGPTLDTGPTLTTGDFGPNTGMDTGFDLDGHGTNMGLSFGGPALGSNTGPNGPNADPNGPNGPNLGPNSPNVAPNNLGGPSDMDLDVQGSNIGLNFGGPNPLGSDMGPNNVDGPNSGAGLNSNGTNIDPNTVSNVEPNKADGPNSGMGVDPNFGLDGHGTNMNLGFGGPNLGPNMGEALQPAIGMGESILGWPGAGRGGMPGMGGGMPGMVGVMPGYGGVPGMGRGMPGMVGVMPGYGGVPGMGRGMPEMGMWGPGMGWPAIPPNVPLPNFGAIHPNVGPIHPHVGPNAGPSLGAMLGFGRGRGIWNPNTRR